MVYRQKLLNALYIDASVESEPDMTAFELDISKLYLILTMILVMIGVFAMTVWSLSPQRFKSTDDGTNGLQVKD